MRTPFWGCSSREPCNPLAIEFAKDITDFNGQWMMYAVMSYGKEACIW